MSVMHTGLFPKLGWPGINAIWGLTYKEWSDKSEWKQIFSVNKSDKAYEEDVSITGLGVAPAKAQGDAGEYGTMKQGYVSRYTNITYFYGFIITQEEIEDNQYPKMAAQRTKGLAKSFYRTQEIVAANILNRGFDTNYKGGDLQPLFSLSHPLESGTVANRPTLAADFSERSLEQAAIDIASFVDAKGNPIQVMPQRIIVPKELMFKATRYLDGKERPDTANRDINALNLMNTFSGGAHVNHYLTSRDAYFIITDADDGLKKFERVALSFAEDNDFDTTNKKYRGRMRESYGWTNPLGAYGNPGA